MLPGILFPGRTACSLPNAMQVMLCIGLVSPPCHFFLSFITPHPLDLLYFSLYTYHYLTLYHMLANSLLSPFSHPLSHPTSV